MNDCHYQSSSSSTENNYKNIGKWLAHPPPGEEVVISGLTGRFPMCENVLHFKNNLLSKVDMVSNKDRRWGKVDRIIPQRYGQISRINKFDPGYFGIGKHEAHSMDPACRLQLEAAIEAILDAGVHPAELEGSNTGVFIATNSSESQAMVCRDDLPYKDVLGVSKSMYANRISYHLKLRGPSTIVDSACCSSLYALRDAYNHIRLGKIDAAIVGGVTVIMKPQLTLMFKKLGVLSEDGACKTFDESADGYVRSETCCAIFLQKFKDSRRVYAKVLHALSNCAGYNDQGITYPSKYSQIDLMAELYDQCEISPSSVEIVEAHGTGTKVGDTVELDAIGTVFCSDRDFPLILCSTKSNMGHAENCAGHCQIVKSLCVMESGVIPPNLHITKPLEVECIRSGKLKIPVENEHFKGITGWIGISSFGFGGANSHCLLEWNKKVKSNNRPLDDKLPRLVCVSGRSEESVNSVFDHMKENAADCEFVALLHKIYRCSSALDLYRGFLIHTKNKEIFRSTKRLIHLEKPHLLILFGGSCFQHIGSDLLCLPLIQQIIQRMNKIVSSKGVSISKLLKGTDAHGMLSTTAIQIAIFEVLKILGLTCLSKASHSNGEIADAFAKGNINLVQALHLAYKYDSLQKGTYGKISNGHHHTDIMVNDEENVNANYILINFQKMEKKSGELDNSEVTRDGKIITLDVEEGIVSFLSAIGRLYELGHNPDIEKLYPSVNFPVSRGTPMISPLLKWDHREDWFVLSYRPEDQPRVFSLKFVIDTKDSEWSYIEGHNIDGRNLFPATGYLFLTWKTFSTLQKVHYEDMRIVFENVKFVRATNLVNEVTEFTVSIQPNGGHFEVIESDAVVATGRIRNANKKDDIVGVKTTYKKPISPIKLLKRDIYKEFRLRGYNYSGMFAELDEYSAEAHLGYIHLPEQNWVAYMDVMLQMCILPFYTRELYVPTHLEKLSINAPKQLKFKKENDKTPVWFDQATRRVQSGYISIQGMNASAITRRKLATEPVLERYVFVPNAATLSCKESVRINIQIILENFWTHTVYIAEVIDTNKDVVPLAQLMCEVLLDFPLIRSKVELFSPFALNFGNIPVENKKFRDVSNMCIAIGQNMMSREAAMNDALNCLSENGFVISREPLDFDVNKSRSTDLEICTVHSVSCEKLVLLRKRKYRSEENFINMSQSAETFEWLRPLQNAVASGVPVTLYSEKQPLSGVLGFFNCLRKEPGGENIKCVFVQDTNAPTFNPNDEFYKNVLDKGLAVNVYKNGKWGTYRHLKLEVPYCKAMAHCFTGIKVRGDLSSFLWVEGKDTSVSDPTKKLVYVYHSALNFRDIMFATNRLQGTLSHNEFKSENPQGFEFSGKTDSGVRVMGICDNGSLATQHVVDEHLFIPVPDGWSLEDAATVPVVYSTVLYAFDVANIRAGQSILIHAGTGGIGQAAINLAKHYGLVIFTTVGTDAKREYIKKNYPYIHESHIGNSRDTSFERLIYRKTRGKGVDIVLNSLAEDKQLASLRCLAYGGMFLEIGKYDLAQNSPLRLETIKRNGVFHGICVDKFFCAEPHKQIMLMNLLKRGIRHGSVKPLQRKCFPGNKIEEAYRYMATGKHMGKVLIKIREEENNSTSNHPPSRKFIDASPRYYCYAQYSYIITGGLGGFGLELADWLVDRGARNLILTSRVGIRTGYQLYRISKWKNDGCEVLISTADISTKEGCEALLKDSMALAPVAAIFHLAVMLEDAILENQTVQSFINSLTPKARAAKLLDELSRNMCLELRDFVVFSSVTCGRGNAGQTNYGMANSVMERICEKRKEENLPALAVQWGAVGDVGLVAEMQISDRELEVGGTLQQRILSCLEVMDRFMTEGNTIVSSIVVADKRGTQNRANNLVEAIMYMLGIKDLKAISMNATLPELGMDSMVANEVKQYLEREKEIFVTASDIRNLTFSRLHQMMLEDKGEQESKDHITTSAEPQKNETSYENRFIVNLSSNTETEDDKLLLLLPGIEGRLSDFDSLLKTLRGHVWGIDYNHTAEADTIQKEASFCFNNITKTISSASSVNIVAHSYGCLVALELAAFLEKQNRLGKLILIDGSPKTLTKLLTENEISQMAQFHKSLESGQRIENVLDRLPKTFVSPDYFKRAVTDIQRRISSVKHYYPSFEKIESAVYLFKPKVTFIQIDEEDYCLSELTEFPIEVKYFEGDHFTMLQDPELGRAINERLQ